MVVEADGLEHVERASRVDVEIGVGIRERGGHRHLAGEVDDRVLVLHRLRQRGGVPHVLFDECGPVRILCDEPPEVALGAGPAEIVEEGDVPAFFDQVLGGVDAEEAGAAGDQDAPVGLGGRRRV